MARRRTTFDPRDLSTVKYAVSWVPNTQSHQGLPFTLQPVSSAYKVTPIFTPISNLGKAKSDRAVILEYSENRNLYSIEPLCADTDSPFEDSVYCFLRNNNYEARKQVGCAGFRVDLAIVDPEHPGRYILGIECDGAKYHSSPVARDRDRLRQQILEGMGWRICRICSTDWYRRNRSETKKNLLKAVENAKYEKTILKEPNKVQKPIQIFQENIQKTELSNLQVGEDAIDKLVPDYETCTHLGIPIYGELHEYPASHISKAVIQVVNIEGPVHFEEVIHRIRFLWGLKRAGQRIRHLIDIAISMAVQDGQIKRKKDFLWPSHDKPSIVRRRSGDPPAKIELICDEEIAEAVKLVLKSQFATVVDDLITKSSRVFGIHVTHEATAERIRNVIQRLLDTGELQRMANGMINLPGS